MVLSRFLPQCRYTKSSIQYKIPDGYEIYYVTHLYESLEILNKLPNGDLTFCQRPVTALEMLYLFPNITFLSSVTHWILICTVVDQDNWIQLISDHYILGANSVIMTCLRVSFFVINRCIPKQYTINQADRDQDWMVTTIHMGIKSPY